MNTSILDPSANNGNGQRPNSLSNWRDLTRTHPWLHADAAKVLAEIFAEADARSVHVLSLPGDPGRSGKWWGGRLGGGYRLWPGDNHYACISELDTRSVSRRNSDVIAYRALLIDDVGTKVDVHLLQTLCAQFGLVPACVIATSPGNFQWLLVLARPIDAHGEREALTQLLAVRDALGAPQWGDDVQDGSRYFRLPGGRNGKAEYGAPSPLVRLAAYNPGARVTLDQLTNAFGVAASTASPTGHVPTSRTIQRPSAGGYSAKLSDRVVRLAHLVGLAPRLGSRAGIIDAECPNEANHGHRDGRGFAFLHSDVCHCHHAACADLRSSDFIDLIVKRYNAQLQTEIAAHRLRPRAGGYIDCSGEVWPSSGAAYLAAYPPLTPEECALYGISQPTAGGAK